MSRHIPRPPHRYLPSDEDRNAAITHIARNVDEPEKLFVKLELGQHFADFRRVVHRVLVTYTPRGSTNQQSSDWVNLGVPMVSSR